MKVKEKNLKEWMKSKDCYGNQMVSDTEELHIRKRLKGLNDITIVQGDINTQHPNKILVDITDLTPSNFQIGKKVIISLSHFLRPCLCKECEHLNQYECYIEDCTCCTDECT